MKKPKQYIDGHDIFVPLTTKEILSIIGIIGIILTIAGSTGYMAFKLICPC